VKKWAAQWKKGGKNHFIRSNNGYYNYSYNRTGIGVFYRSSNYSVDNYRNSH